MTKKEIPVETITKIEEYIAKNFSKTFSKKPIIIEEKNNFFTIKPHKDFGPIVISKEILK